MYPLPTPHPQELGSLPLTIHWHSVHSLADAPWLLLICCPDSRPCPRDKPFRQWSFRSSLVKLLSANEEKPVTTYWRPPPCFCPTKIWVIEVAAARLLCVCSTVFQLRSSHQIFNAKLHRKQVRFSKRFLTMCCLWLYHRTRSTIKKRESHWHQILHQ